MLTTLYVVLFSTLCSLFASATPLPEALPTNVTFLEARDDYDLARYSPGGFQVTASDSPFLQGTYPNVGGSQPTYSFYFRGGDAQFFVWDGSQAVWTNGVSGADCYTPGSCTLTFQSDGNLVARRNGNAFWDSSTYGRGVVLYFLYRPTFQYMLIADNSGTIIWSTNQAFVPPQPPGCQPGQCCTC